MTAELVDQGQGQPVRSDGPGTGAGVKAAALRAAFPHTVPVLTGFSFLGMAFGILMASKGYGVGWTFLMSLFVFAGSAQYVGITFLTTVFNPVDAFLLTLMINARHLFYGLSLLDKFRAAGRLKPYLIFGLTDETFSILCSAEPPEGVDRRWFMFFVTVLNHGYWVLGSVMGGLVGSMLTFNTRGLDFVLTALFVVIFISQWKSQKKHGPAVIGVASSVACLLIFGPDRFIIPAMVAILVILLLFREKLQVAEVETLSVTEIESVLVEPVLPEDTRQSGREV